MARHSPRRFVLCCALLLAVPAGAAEPSGPAPRPVAPEDPASPVAPRRFGFPGGVGPTRGWYVWRRFDPDTWTAEVSHEATGERFTTRVLPWATTYRYLVYGAHPDELLAGERVNLFFAPDGERKRGFLVHFQDELCQMKGHGHVWEVQSAAADGRHFRARVLAGDRPLDGQVVSFDVGEKAEHWRAGRRAEQAPVREGDRLYMTWVYREGRRVVQLTADGGSLDALREVERRAVDKRLAADGLAAHVEAVDGAVVHLLIFPTYWSQAAGWKEGDAVEVRTTAARLRPVGDGVAARVVSRKNLGTYGSGATELTSRLVRDEDGRRVKGWMNGTVVRVRRP